MYSNESARYWKKRNKKKPFCQRKEGIATLLIVFFIISYIFLSSFIIRDNSDKGNKDGSNNNNIPVSLPRPHATLEDFKKCSSHFKTFDIIGTSNEKGSDDTHNTDEYEEESKIHSHYNHHNHNQIASRECTLICNTERMSIPRPTMHQACLHGCSKGFAKNVELGCYNKTLSENISASATSSEGGGHQHEYCYKYQNRIPKPELYSTCLNYYKKASRRGYQMGLEYLEEEIERKWNVLRDTYAER